MLAHGGDISACSKGPNQGSSFTISLPIRLRIQKENENEIKWLYRTNSKKKFNMVKEKPDSNINTNVNSTTNNDDHQRQHQINSYPSRELRCNSHRGDSIGSLISAENDLNERSEYDFDYGHNDGIGIGIGNGNGNGDGGDRGVYIPVSIENIKRKSTSMLTSTSTALFVDDSKLVFERVWKPMTELKLWLS
eukprot:gene3845-7666_t